VRERLRRPEPRQGRSRRDGQLRELLLAPWRCWIIGEFTNATEIQAGDTIKIYELGQSHPLSTEGNDEPYEAFIATEIACVDDADPQVNCMIQLTAEAEGTATLPVAAF
jgi:hypothetical protein